MFSNFCLNVLSKNTSTKKISHRVGEYSPHTHERCITPTYTEIIHHLTFAVINKCFKFQNNWLKIIRIKTANTSESFCTIGTLANIKLFLYHFNFLF